MKPLSIFENQRWYGERPKSMTIQHYQAQIKNVHDDWEALKVLVALFQLGDFSLQYKLVDILEHSSDEDILMEGIRLFYLVSSGDDLNVINRLVSTDNLNVINTVALYAPLLLSLDIIPYLLSLVEHYEGTEVEETCRDSIDIILNDYDFEPDCPVEELADGYYDKLQEIEAHKKFYYRGEPACAGNLSKELMERAALSRYQKKKLGIVKTPLLLSVWSGIPCPVHYHTVVDDSLFEAVLNYIEQISNCHLEVGHKYFYGHKRTRKGKIYLGEGPNV